MCTRRSSACLHPPHRQLIGEMFNLPGLPVSHVTDNTAVAPLTENLGVSRKSEHFRRWQNFARYLE